MTNELAAFGGTELSLDDIAAGLDNTLMNAPRVESKAGTNYLKLRDMNDWVFGKEATEIEADDEFIVEISAFTHGYVAWHMKRPEFQKMVPMNVPLSSIKLPDPGSIKAKSGIEDARGVVMAGLGAWQGQRFDYTVNTRGGREAIEGLIETIRTRLRNGQTDAYPVITLASSSYIHSEHGEIIKPVFKVKEWHTRADALALAAGQDPTPAPAPEPEPVKDEAPRRRRAKA